MKKALKIIVVILIIVALAVGAYFLFFDIDRNLSVYHGVQDAMQYKYDLDFDEDLYGLSVLGYNEGTQEFTEAEYPSIYIIREKLFQSDSSSKLVGGTEQSGLFYYYGYVKYEEIIVQGIRFYSNYAVLADKASKMYANQVCSKIDSYTASIEKLWDSAKSLKTVQNVFGKEDSEVTEEMILEQYQDLRDLYRNHLKTSSDLLINLRDFVIKESFDGVYSFDTVAMLYDSVAHTVYTAMTNKQEQEINYLHDATIYVDLYEAYVSSNAIDYGFADEVDYLTAYTNMYTNNREDYNKLFEFTHFQKQELVRGDNDISAQIKVGYVDYARIIISILGL